MSRRWLWSVLPVGLGLVGLAMIALPWLPTGQPNPWPARFGPDSVMTGTALDLLRQIDRACEAGDVVQLRTLVSEEYLGSLQEKLRWLGRRLDGLGLRSVAGGADAGLAAELALRPCLGGRSRGDRAVLLWQLGEVQLDAGYPVRHGLKALVLEWDGAAFRVHAVQEQPLPPGADVTAAADALYDAWQN